MFKFNLKKYQEFKNLGIRQLTFDYKENKKEVHSFVENLFNINIFNMFPNQTNEWGGAESVDIFFEKYIITIRRWRRILTFNLNEEEMVKNIILKIPNQNDLLIFPDTYIAIEIKNGKTINKYKTNSNLEIIQKSDKFYPNKKIKEKTTFFSNSDISHITYYYSLKGKLFLKKLYFKNLEYILFNDDIMQPKRSTYSKSTTFFKENIEYFLPNEEQDFVDLFNLVGH